MQLKKSMRNSMANRNKEKPLLRNVYHSQNAILKRDIGIGIGVPFRAVTPEMRSSTPNFARK